MSEHETFDGMVAKIKDSATVRNVYGDPIQAGDKTIVPVANVAYGFGGGESKEDRGGFGGGGGMRARPIGVLEITGAETKWVPLNPLRTIAIAAGAGILAGMILGRRSSRHRQQRKRNRRDDGEESD